MEHLLHYFNLQTGSQVYYSQHHATSIFIWYFFISSCFHSFSFVIIFTFILKMFLVPQEWHISAKECVLAVTKTIPPFHTFIFISTKHEATKVLKSFSQINLYFSNAIIFSLILPMQRLIQKSNLRHQRQRGKIKARVVETTLIVSRFCFLSVHSSSSIVLGF